MAGGAEHHLSPLGSSFGGVTGEIVGSEISFGLDNPAHQSSVSMPVHEKLAEQLLGNIDGRLFVK